MRITKYGKLPDEKINEYEEANQFCHVCPVCFEEIPETKYWYKGVMTKGITKTILVRYWSKGFHKYKGTITAYRCITCGTEWESEPYNVKKLNWFGLGGNDLSGYQPTEPYFVTINTTIKCNGDVAQER